MAIVAESITIKGTRHGLLIGIREDADFSAALSCLGERLAKDGALFGGSTMTVDLGWREVAPAEFDQLEATLAQHSVGLAGILSTSLNTRTLAESRGHKAIIGRLGLAKHMGRNLKREAETASVPEVACGPEPVAAQVMAEMPGGPAASGAAATVPSVASAALAGSSAGAAASGAAASDGAAASGGAAASAGAAASVGTAASAGPAVPAASIGQAAAGAGAPQAAGFMSPAESTDEKEQEATLYIRRTLRSGQRVLYGGNVIIVGDVNPGAEVEAEGDVVVIGCARGRLHAGSGGNSQAQIWALNLQPTQLRLADAIWVPDKRPKFNGPVKAVLQGKEIHLMPGGGERS